MTQNAGEMRRPWLHLAVLTVSLVLITGEARPAEASFPGDNGRIAFSSATTGSSGSSQWTLNSVRADGTGRQSLGPGTGTGSFSPAYSANGKKIAYTYSRGEFGDDIYTANADGSRARNLTSRTSHPYRATQPAWSPNGSQILFVDDQSWYGDILVMDADGSRQRQLAVRPAFSDTNPAWSPDGSMIVFASARLGAGTATKSALWLMSSAGSGQRQLTASNGYHTEPSWQPLSG